MEFWERFSFYGLQALLVFYLTRHLGMSTSDAITLFSSYAALASATLVFGAIIAELLTGLRRAVLIGCVLLVAGHCVLMVHGSGIVSGGDTANAGLHSNDPALRLLCLALSLIAVGVGFIKSCATAMVGSLYAGSDPRRDVGFTIYYTAVNLGAVTAPLVCGLLGETLGWTYGFGAAAVGMCVGFLIFLRGYGLFDDIARSEAVAAALKRHPIRNWLIVVASVGFVVCAVFWLIENPTALGLLCVGIGASMVVALIVIMFRSVEAEERNRIGVILVLLAFSVVFWSLYRMTGGSLNIFAERFVDRHIVGMVVPATSFQSLEPFFVIVLSPALAFIWSGRLSLLRVPSAFQKIGAGILLAGASFLILTLGIHLSNSDSVRASWLIAFYLVLAAADVNVIPIGLSAMSRLGPRMPAFLVAAWYFASSFGLVISGRVGSLMFSMPKQSVFAALSCAGLLSGVCFLSISKRLKRLSGF